MPVLNPNSVLARNRRYRPDGVGPAGRVYGFGRFGQSMGPVGFGDGVPPDGQTEAQALASGRNIWETSWGQAVDPVSHIANWVWDVPGQYAIGTNPDGTTYPIFGSTMDATFNVGTVGAGTTEEEKAALEKYYGVPLSYAPAETGGAAFYTPSPTPTPSPAPTPVTVAPTITTQPATQPIPTAPTQPYVAPTGGMAPGSGSLTLQPSGGAGGWDLPVDDGGGGGGGGGGLYGGGDGGGNGAGVAGMSWMAVAALAAVAVLALQRKRR